MRVLREIRDGCANSTITVADLLRKATILAATLCNEALRTWVKAELSGYSGDEAIPSYRTFQAELLGTVRGPGEIIMRHQIPTFQMPEALKRRAKSITLPHSLGELESMASQDDLRHPWPPEVVLLLNRSIQLTYGYTLVEAYQPISQANIRGILDAVRDRLLEFVLGLQELSPAALDSEDELARLQDQAGKVFSVTITGNNNVVASGEGISQQAMQGIRPMDRRSLEEHMRIAGVPEEAIGDLRRAIEDDGIPSSEGKLGSRVTRWIDGAATKVLESAWKVASNAGVEVLKKALLEYYGWS
jgi:hypothetical protein